MTRAEFAQKLKALGALSPPVHFENAAADGYYVLKNRHRWEVFYRERGMDEDCLGFPSEEDALAYLIEKLTKA